MFWVNKLEEAAKPSSFSKNCPEVPASSTGPINTAF